LRFGWHGIKGTRRGYCYHFATIARKQRRGDALANALKCRRPKIRVHIHRESRAVVAEQSLHKLGALIVGDERGREGMSKCVKAPVRQLRDF
jgi:hypothetical protein